MNKQEYLDRLEKGLQIVTESIRSDILDDIRLHFEQGLSEGRREGEIIDELGPIEDLLQELGQFPEEKKDAAIDKQKVLPVRQLNIDGLIANVTLVKSQDDRVNVKMTKGGKLIDRALYLLRTTHEQDIFEIRVDRMFDLNSKNTQIELFVEVPGKVKIIELKHVSGKIRIEELILDQLVVSTANGDVFLKKSMIDRISLNNADGDFHLEEVIVKHLKVNSASGDVHVHGFAESVKINTASGDIDLETPGTKDLNISTVSGDAQIKTKHENLNMKLNFKTMSGCIMYYEKDVEKVIEGSGIYEFGQGEASITISTVSGDVKFKK